MDYEELHVNYINGNIGIFKESFNKMTKKEMLNFMTDLYNLGYGWEYIIHICCVGVD